MGAEDDSFRMAIVRFLVGSRSVRHGEQKQSQSNSRLNDRDDPSSSHHGKSPK
jgi:hypothetical protein